MSNDSGLNQLTYEWPPNLTEYEAKIFLGLTTGEAIAGSLAFLIPIATLQNTAGFVVAIISAAVVLLSIKKFDRFGNRSLPVYFFARWLEGRQQPEVELPLILGPSSSYVELENWEGETIMVMEG